MVGDVVLLSGRSMICAASQLQAHLDAVVPVNESVEGLVSLARLFWCTLSVLPPDLQTLCLGREEIALAFAQWSAMHRPEDAGTAGVEFWDAQIKDTLKTETAFDLEVAARRYGNLQATSE